MPIQRTDARIPLAGSRDNPLAAFVQQRNQEKRNDLFEARAAATEQNTAAQGEAIEAAKQQAAGQAQKLAEFESIVRGVNELEPLIPNSIEGVPAFIQAAQRRSDGIRSTGGNSDDTDLIIQMAQAGDFDGIRQQFGEVRNLQKKLQAKQLGVSNTPDNPSAVREFNFFEGLSKEQKKEFLQVKRATTRLGDVGGTPSIIGLEDASVTPLSTPEVETQVASKRAGAIESSKQTAQLEAISGNVATAGQAKRDQDNINAGFVAADSLPILNRGLELLDLIGTGKPAEIALAFKNAFGITGADEGELSANLGKAVLSQLRSTFGAQFTEKEGDRLAAIEAGFGKSTPTNRRLLQQAKRLVERTAKRGAKSARNIGDEALALEIEKAANFSLSPEESKATKRFNPETGQIEVIE